VGSDADEPAAALYRRAEEIAAPGGPAGPPVPRPSLTSRLDKLVISPGFGIPFMLALLAGVLWLTLMGAGYPSELLAAAFSRGERHLSLLLNTAGFPRWLHDPLVLG